MSRGNRISIWANSDSEDINNKTNDKRSIIQTFVNAKNYFQPQCRDNNNDYNEIGDLNENDEVNQIEGDKEELQQGNDIDTDIKKQFLNKKTERVDQDQGEGEGQGDSNRIEDEVGPHPITIEYDKKEERRMYQNMNINPTEAQLYAQYIQKGKRIPRRGEVGISSNEIEYFESIGYVMSGTRHKKMNAARQRIEGKVYSAEDKRALSIFNLEENLRKEKNIINAFQHMLKTNNNSNTNNNNNDQSNA